MTVDDPIRRSSVPLRSLELVAWMWKRLREMSSLVGGVRAATSEQTLEKLVVPPASEDERCYARTDLVSPMANQEHCFSCVCTSIGCLVETCTAPFSLRGAAAWVAGVPPPSCILDEEVNRQDCLAGFRGYCDI